MAKWVVFVHPGAAGRRWSERVGSPSRSSRRRGEFIALLLLFLLSIILVQ